MISSVSIDAKPFGNHNAISFLLNNIMPAVTIKNIPESLYDRLKVVAASHHRSINNEVIHCLEKTLLPQRISSTERLQRARLLRSGVVANAIHEDAIQVAIEEGRP